jgi:hypothetical protein
MSEDSEEIQGTSETKANGKRGKTTAAKVTVSPSPKDERLWLYLDGLFPHVATADGYVAAGPDKIALCAVYGATGMRQGPVVKEWPFAARECPDKERLVELSNEILRLIQADCDVLNRRTKYGVLAYDAARSDRAIGRHLIAVSPSGMTTALDDERGGGAGEDEDGGAMSTRLLLGILQDERKDKRWMTEMLANVVSGALERADERDDRMQAIVENGWQKTMQMMQATEAMLSQASERQIKTSWAKFYQEKLGLAGEKAMGMLEMFVAQRAIAGPAAPNAVAVFLESITDEQGTTAFGALDGSGRAAGGIFTSAQFDLLRKIAGGATVDSADVEAFKTSIKPEQMVAAQQIFSADQLMPLLKWASGAA